MLTVLGQVLLIGYCSIGEVDETTRDNSLKPEKQTTIKQFADQQTTQRYLMNYANVLS